MSMSPLWDTGEVVHRHKFESHAAALAWLFNFVRRRLTANFDFLWVRSVRITVRTD
jgi:hypothetical protein